MEKIKEVFNQLELASNELSKVVSERALAEESGNEMQTDTGWLFDAASCMKTEVLGRIEHYMATCGGRINYSTLGLKDAMIAFKIEKQNKIPRDLRIEKYTELIKICSTLIGHIYSDHLTVVFSDLIETLQDEIHSEIMVASKEARERFYESLGD